MAYIENVDNRFKRWIFLFALCFAALLPYGAHADFELPPGPFLFTTTTLSGEEENAELSSEDPSVEIGISSQEEAYFTRVYICSLFADECDGNSYIRRFDINATTTSFTREWDGTDADGAPVSEDEYQLVIRFYQYELQEDAFEETAPWRIEVISAQEDDNDEESEEEDEDPPEAPSVEFSLNGGFSDVSLSSTSPTTIAATSSAEVYFTHIFVCLEDTESCGLDTHTAIFAVNATSTEIARVWDGTASSTASSSPGIYTALVQYYAYEVSSELFTTTASFSVTVLEEEGEVEADEESEPEPPAYTLITQDTYPTNRNVGAVVWNKAGSPYVVEGDVNFAHGSITIESGVVVKFKEAATLTAHAQFPVSIEGTADQPIVFTSFKDDTAGGDTNGDGTATTPEPGEWGFVSFGSGGTNTNMQIEYLQVRYGGGVENSVYNDSDVRPALVLWFWWANASPGAAYTVENIEVSHSAGTGLYTFVGKNHSLSVSNSSFYENATYGVRKATLFGAPKNSDLTGSVNLSENWWGSESGPHHNSLNPEGEGNAVIGSRISLDSWLSSDPFVQPVYEECCSSVLFLPGIKGSRLYTAGADGEDKLWEPLFFPETPGDIERLHLTKDGTSINSVYTKVGDVLDAAGGTEYYRPLITDMQTLVDSETIAGFAAAAYDWRLSLDDIVNRGYQDGKKLFYGLATSTPYIEQTLRRLAQESQTGKVTIVAHSNGGLVAKKLVGKLGETEAQTLIDQIIFVGAPQSGAPQAIGALLYGYREDIALANLSKASARTLAENSPGAYQLLPSQAYFDSVRDIDHPVASFEGSTYAVEQDTYGFHVNTWDELAAFLLAEEGGRVKPSSSDVKSANVLNQTLVEYAKSTHDALDTWVPPPSITLHQIAGWGVDTIAGIRFYDVAVPGSGETVQLYKPVIVEDGDGVVPVPSALMTSTSTDNVQRWWVDLEKHKQQYALSKNKKHGDIFAVSELRNFISSLIEQSPEEFSFISHQQPTVNESSKKLHFFLHSPLTLTVLDADGNTVGEYDEFGDVKYVTIPAGPTYTVKLTGYDSGTFALQIEEVQGGAVVATSTVANVPSTNKTTATLTIGNGIATASTLSVDINGDGEEDTSISFKENETVLYEALAEESIPEDSSAVPPTPAGGGPLWVTNSTSPTPTVLGVATSTSKIDTAIAPDDTDAVNVAPTTTAPNQKVKTQQSFSQITSEKEINTNLKQKLVDTTIQTASVTKSGILDLVQDVLKTIIQALQNLLNLF